MRVIPVIHKFGCPFSTCILQQIWLCFVAILIETIFTLQSFMMSFTFSSCDVKDFNRLGKACSTSSTSVLTEHRSVKSQVRKQQTVSHLHHLFSSSSASSSSSSSSSFSINCRASLMASNSL